MLWVEDKGKGYRLIVAILVWEMKFGLDDSG